MVRIGINNLATKHGISRLASLQQAGVLTSARAARQGVHSESPQEARALPIHARDPRT
jgi:hypothetical protein